MPLLQVLITVLVGSSLVSAEGCSGGCRGQQHNSKFPPGIDYVQLAVQSAQGFCEVKHCDTSFTGWSIHGLWPSQKGAMGPNGCNGSASFDTDAISAIMNEMNQYWPTLMGSDPTGFWCHEWCKHGTCAVAGLDAVTSMLSYFQSALMLFTQTNMNQVFNDFVSTSNGTFKLADVQNLFSPSPAFECTDYKDGQLLYSARFCYTPDLTPAECNMDWFVSLKPCQDGVPIYYL